MINNAVYLNASWFLPILGGAILLLGIFLWKEWSQAGKHRFLIKSILAFFAVTSLFLVALKPALPTSKKGGDIVLLTQGYDKVQLDSLRKAEEILKLLNYEPGKPLPAAIRSSRKVFVLGHGLKEYDLWQLEEIPAFYISPEPPDGVIKLNYEVENSIGDNMLLQGLYKNPIEGYKLVLSGPGGAGLDSIALRGEDKQVFQFITPLKAKGNYIYSLTEKNTEGKIINTNVIPVKVAEKVKLRILVLNSFPTFETRYLKNFLAEAGNEVVVRSQITRNRFKFEYLNTGSIALGNLTEQTLESFDLLIVDASSLRGFSGSQKTVIENMVREQGLGLFLQPDDAFFNSSGQLNILNFKSFTNTEINEPQWPGITLNTYPYRIRKEFGIQEIHTSGTSIISAYKKVGEGKIGTAVYSETWQLILGGKNQVYGELWSKLIEELSRKEVPYATWHTDAVIGQIGEPFEFELRTEVENPNVTTGSGSIIPLIQDPSISYLWKGTTWPKEKGWNTLHLDTTSVHHFYVEDNTSGSKLRTFKTQQANQRYFASEMMEGRDNSPLEPVNPLWFLGLFLICMGGLWLEPKL